MVQVMRNKKRKKRDKSAENEVPITITDKNCEHQLTT